MDVNSNIKEGSEFLKSFNGPEEDELSGLNIEERKRQRSEAHEFSDTTIFNQHSHQGSVLSHNDCPDTTTNVLATLARQASHPK